MVWKITDGDAVAPVGKMFTTKGVKIPPTWSSWTSENKKIHGLYWEDDPVVEKFDNRFYNSVGKEKSLTDVNAVDDKGKAIIDVRTGKQAVELGLKSIWISRTKATANQLLSKSDWEVTRKAEKGTAMASATSTYRDKVRTACDTIETKINNCSKLSEFIALFDAPVDSDGEVTGANAPIYDFPDEV
tara:strand:+ start:13461 stop:14021 length:561 start_codon:yes stop_codon:yes gene_type:complete